VDDVVTPDSRADESSSVESRMTSPKAALTVGIVGVLLAVTLFPLAFDHVTYYDDEGLFLVTIRQFLHHGSLYEHTAGGYGPFYYSFMGSIFRLIGQDPSPLNGRIVVLSLTVISAGIFAAAVWRVTRSVLFGVVAEVATFCTLITVAGNEPLHPGSVIVLMLSVLVYALASYAVEPRARLLAVAGGAVGALLMTKVNVGIFAAVGLSAALVVGNPAYPRWFRRIVAAGAVLLPFVLTFQRLSVLVVATFAVLISLSLLGVFVVMGVDRIQLSPRDPVVAASAALAVTFGSWLWPLFHGTSPDALYRAVFIRPLDQVNLLEVLPTVPIQWFVILVTLVTVIVACARRDLIGGLLPVTPAMRHLVLAIAALWVLALGLTPFGGWLPAIALLPALALIADASVPEKLALRLIIPIAILQVLHAYPVAGSQVAWATVAVFVPAVIALAVGMRHQRFWVGSPMLTRVVAIGLLCVVVVLEVGITPEALRDYYAGRPLHVAGTRLLRIDAQQGRNIERLARVVKANCDTFYSAPGFNSLYVYTGLPVPTGLLNNWPDTLNRSEQREVAGQLAELDASGQRLCIVRNLSRPAPFWPSSTDTKSRLRTELDRFHRVVAVVGGQPVAGSSARYPVYSVSIRGAAGSRPENGVPSNSSGTEPRG
jgi:hypothetical protein